MFGRRLDDDGPLALQPAPKKAEPASVTVLRPPVAEDPPAQRQGGSLSFLGFPELPPEPEAASGGTLDPIENAKLLIQPAVLARIDASEASALPREELAHQ